MKKRRIEITVSRRRTTIHLRNNLAAATVEPPLTQAPALPALAANLSPAKEAELLPPESNAASAHNSRPYKLGK